MENISEVERKIL